MNLKIFVELNKDTLNESQRKLVEDLENLLHNIIELDRHYNLIIEELTVDYIQGVIGTFKGPLWIKLKSDGVFYFKLIGSSRIQPPGDLKDSESLKYFKEYLGEFEKEQNTETKGWFPRLSKRNKRKRRR